MITKTISIYSSQPKRKDFTSPLHFSFWRLTLVVLFFGPLEPQKVLLRLEVQPGSMWLAQMLIHQCGESQMVSTIKIGVEMDVFQRWVKSRKGAQDFCGRILANLSISSGPALALLLSGSLNRCKICVFFWS